MKYLALAAVLGACGAQDRAFPLETPHGKADGASSAAAPARLVSGWRYSLAPNDGFTRMTVRVCLDGRPAALVPIGPEARRVLADTGPGLEPVGGKLAVRSLDRGCTQYVVDLARAARVDHDLVAHSEDDLLVGTPLWLWAPARHAKGASGTAAVAGAEVALPWDRSGGAWVLDPAAFQFDAPMVLGSPGHASLHVAGDELRVVRMSPDDAPDPSAIRAWLDTSARAVAGLFGRFPVDDATVVILPVEGSKRPVACGYTYRGGGASLVLRVSRDATLDSLRSEDAIAIHEMMHLGLPYVEGSDAWLSEGLATYYQEILRARAGLQTEAVTWQRLRRRLAPRRSARRGSSLCDVPAHPVAELDRIYRGGTALAFLSDVALRRRGVATLDRAVRALGACCAWPPEPHGATDLLARIDRALGTSLVSDTARDAHRTDLSSTWRYLGVHFDARGRATLDDTAPGAPVRRAIVSGD